MNYETSQQPKIAGKYIINDGLIIEFKQKPSLFHRLMTRWLLGWKWIDNNEGE